MEGRMKKFRDDAVDIIAENIRKKNPDLEIFLGNKTQPLNDLDPQELARLGLEWGKLSLQGLCCGIMGCNTEPEIRCKICNGGYCKDHKDWHHHRADNDGIYEKEVEEI